MTTGTMTTAKQHSTERMAELELTKARAAAAYASSVQKDFSDQMVEMFGPRASGFKLERLRGVQNSIIEGLYHTKTRVLSPQGEPTGLWAAGNMYNGLEFELYMNPMVSRGGYGFGFFRGASDTYTAERIDLFTTK